MRSNPIRSAERLVDRPDRQADEQGCGRSDRHALDPHGAEAGADPDDEEHEQDHVVGQEVDHVAVTLRGVAAVPSETEPDVRRAGDVEPGEQQLGAELRRAWSTVEVPLGAGGVVAHPPLRIAKRVMPSLCSLSVQFHTSGWARRNAGSAAASCHSNSVRQPGSVLAGDVACLSEGQAGERRTVVEPAPRGTRRRPRRCAPCGARPPRHAAVAAAASTPRRTAHRRRGPVSRTRKRISTSCVAGLDLHHLRRRRRRGRRAGGDAHRSTGGERGVGLAGLFGQGGDEVADRGGTSHR